MAGLYAGFAISPPSAARDKAWLGRHLVVSQKGQRPMYSQDKTVLRAVGGNPEAARRVGLPVGRWMILAMAIGGALAGLAVIA